MGVCIIVYGDFLFVHAELVVVMAMIREFVNVWHKCDLVVHCSDERSLVALVPDLLTFTSAYCRFMFVVVLDSWCRCAHGISLRQWCFASINMVSNCCGFSWRGSLKEMVSFFVVSLSLVVRVDEGFGSDAASLGGSWWKKGFVGICI